jgi:hypothetical protein
MEKLVMVLQYRLAQLGIAALQFAKIARKRIVHNKVDWLCLDKQEYQANCRHAEQDQLPEISFNNSCFGNSDHLPFSP